MIESEADVWKYLKSGLGPLKVELQRIETGSTGGGVFDVNALYNGIEVWIELKYNENIFRREQRAWCLRRLKKGGRMWLLSASSVGQLYLWSGLDAIHRYPNQPTYKPVNWPELRDILFDG